METEYYQAHKENWNMCPIAKILRRLGVASYSSCGWHEWCSRKDKDDYDECTGRRNK